jgi:hypothetical protein
LNPVSRDWPGLGFLRGPDGYAIYAVLGDERQKARAVVYAFTTGELWSIDTYWLDAMTRENRNEVPNVDQDFRNTLKDYGAFLAKLGIKPPYRWIAGMEDLKGRDLFVPAPPGRTAAFNRPQGKGLVPVVEASGLYSPGDSPAAVLKPFFVKLYDSCGVGRQGWQDA